MLSTGCVEDPYEAWGEREPVQARRQTEEPDPGLEGAL